MSINSVEKNTEHQEHNTDGKLSFLSGEVDSNIIILKTKVKSSKTKTSFLNILTVSLSASITLSLGIEVVNFEVYQKNLALILAAILTIVNGWALLFNYKNKVGC